jgi:hypothetical protein
LIVGISFGFDFDLLLIDYVVTRHLLPAPDSIPFHLPLQVRPLKLFHCPAHLLQGHGRSPRLRIHVLEVVPIRIGRPAHLIIYGVLRLFNLFENLPVEHRGLIGKMLGERGPLYVSL